MGDTLSIPERILHLKKADVLETLSVGDLAVVAQVAQEVEFEPGAVIYQQGEANDRLLVLVSGEMSATQTTGEQPEKELARFGPGESIGILNVIAEVPSPVAVRALQACRCLEIRLEDFQEMLHGRPEIAVGLCKILGTRLLMLLDRANTSA